MPIKDPIRSKYNRQILHSKRRGIEFLFTFEEWVRWWECHLGPNWMLLRGNRKNQYVMARKLDQGPYRKDNVDCLTNSQNTRDSNKQNPRGNRNGSFKGRTHSKATREKLRAIRKGEKNPATKITKQIVYMIKSSTLSQRELAKQFEVSQAQISNIKTGKSWLI